MTDRNVDRLLDAWMALGPTVAPARVAEAVRLEARSTRQTATLRGWPPRRSPVMNVTARYALAAAAAVVAALLGYAYFSRPDVGGPVDGEPSPTPAASLEAGLPILAEQEGPLQPGTYVVTDVEPLRIGITVPAGWTKNIIDAAVWTENSTVHILFGRVENVYADPCAQSDGLLDPPVGPTTEDLASALAALPGLDVAVGEVSLSGYPGTYLEMTPADPVDGWCSGSSVLWDLPNGEHFGGPARFGTTRIWIVDVDGDRLVMAAEVRSAASAAETVGLQQIVDSVQIEP